MEKKNRTIEDKLKDASFRNLSEAESARVWASISEKVAPRPIFSLFQLQANRKNMIPLIIGLIMFAGVGTSVAANGAAPGDVLFPVDRAIEKVQLGLSTSANAKAELKARLAEERLKEVQELIAKARLEASASTTATSSATTTPTRADGRVAVGVNFAISFLNEVAADVAASGNAEAAAEIRSVVATLEDITNDADVKAVLKSNDDFKFKLQGTSVNATTSATTTSQVKVNTSGNKTRIEVREEGDRIKIEIKDDGRIEVKSKTEAEVEVEDEDNDEDNDERDQDEREDEDNDRSGNKGRNDARVNGSGNLKIEIR